MSTFLQGPGSSTGPGPPATATDDYIVRIPRTGRKKVTMMKFGSGASVDFSKIGEQSIKIERENNFKEYKSANDLETMPKFGAGSEYGRDLKEESRRKKYGIMLKKYSPEDQPWQLKIGTGKNTKKFKGVREGSILENTSYYVFIKAADGAFEAFPVEEWYNFSPIIRYKYLNSDEAEEEFSRRDKTLNLFTVMLKKRYQKDEDKDLDEDEDDKKKKGKKGKKKTKNLQLTDMEDWDDLEHSGDEDSDSANDSDGVKSKKKKKLGKKAPKKVGRAKNSKMNSDDEAIEESDEGDYEDREVDYMSDSGDSSDGSTYEEEKAKKESNYDDKGVDQEAGLRNILDSDAEDEEDEEEDGQKDDQEEDNNDKDDKEQKKDKGPDDSSSSSSEDDSDIEEAAVRASDLFLPGSKKIKKEKKEKPEVELPLSIQKPVTSTNGESSKEKGIKRKVDNAEDGKSATPSVKKYRVDDSMEAQIEEDLRKYLTRKPMTTKDLLKKFNTKKLSMTYEKLQQVITQLLKKINPDRNTINKKLYLSLKKSD